MGVWPDHWCCCPDHSSDPVERDGVDGSYDRQAEEGKQEAATRTTISSQHRPAAAQIHDGGDSDDGYRECRF